MEGTDLGGEMSPPLRRGLSVPPFDALADPATLAELAVSAEAAGWDGFFLWDHLLHTDPDRPVADPWISLAAIAAATSRIALGPMVTPLPRRRPAVLARQAVSLDRLSGGRLILGFGSGDDGGVGELSRLGEELDARRRGAMLTEGLEVLTALLSGEEVRHRGEHYVADGARFAPAPVRTSGIPIWLASRWPKRAPVRRAAGYDGVFPIGLTGPADLETLREWVASERTRSGPFDFVVAEGPDEDPAPWARAGVTWLLTRVGRHHLEVDAVRAIIEAGPRSASGA